MEKTKRIMLLLAFACIAISLFSATVSADEQSYPDYLLQRDLDMLLQFFPANQILYFDPVAHFGIKSVDYQIPHSASAAPGNKPSEASYILHYVRREVPAPYTSGPLAKVSIRVGIGKHYFNIKECHEKMRRISIYSPVLGKNFHFCAAATKARYMIRDKTHYVNRYTFIQIKNPQDPLPVFFITGSDIMPDEFKNFIQNLRYHSPY